MLIIANLRGVGLWFRAAETAYICAECSITHFNICKSAGNNELKDSRCHLCSPVFKLAKSTYKLVDKDKVLRNIKNITNLSKHLTLDLAGSSLEPSPSVFLT